MLTAIQGELRGLVRSTWASDVQAWGERVALYRRYAEGDHDSKLTPEMRAMLRVTDSQLDRFNANYCELVIQAMSDRMTVTAIEGDTPDATEWAKGVMEANRFDTLQMDVDEDMLASGDAFLIAGWSEDESRVVWAHEPAYDGDYGMIPVYDRMRRNLVAAIKIWYEGDAKRVNLYLPGEIKKYVWQGTEESLPKWALKLEKTEDWTDTKNAANGVPVIPFKNRGSTYTWHGKSELASAIPLQNVLDRTLYSMVMVEELSAFPVPIAIGFNPPAALMPGAWIVITGPDGTPLNKDDVVKVDVLQQAQLVPFISQAEFTIDQISSVTQTPILSAMGSSSSSGEALKQRETGLIGKVKRAQTRTGNSWEDAIKLAARLQDAYGTKKAPDSNMWRTVWMDANPRNDTEVIDNAKKVRDDVGIREFLRLISSVYNYDEKKIESIMAERDEEASSAMRQTQLPGFDQFGAGTDLNQPPIQQPSANDPNNAQVIDPAALQQALALEAAGA